MIGFSFEKHKPALAMVVVQCIFTFGTLAAKALFSVDVKPMVFVTYRQAVAALIMVPITLYVRGTSRIALGLKGFTLVFVASLIGCTLNQYFYYQGLKMTSSSIGSAMNNLIPAVTFLMAAIFGLEKVKVRSLRSMAKVVGTVICVGGAISMAFYKGPKLLSMKYQTLNTILNSVSNEWIMGFVYLTAATCCGSLWLILQVPICQKYLDPLSLATWMCTLSTFQSAALTYSLESNLQAWKITSTFEVLSIVYTGIFASGLTFYVQSWVISERGPVFSALFNPVQIVIATILASILLHEDIHIGSLIGAAAVVGGLYIVLWGKSEELGTTQRSNLEDGFGKPTISAGVQCMDGESCIKEPLLDQGPIDPESQGVQCMDGESCINEPLLDQGPIDPKSQVNLS